EIVSGQKPRTAENTVTWDKLDCNAQKIIVTSLGDENVLYVINCEISTSMWSNLQSVFEHKSDAYEKHPDDNVSVHVAKLQRIARQLEDLGENIMDNMLIIKIMITLPESYNHFYSAWEATQKTEITLNNLD
uniref:Copia protein n=1 Tax=Megaselia scalaris TaxID=36166 RepID=T1GDW3_MEGSC